MALKLSSPLSIKLFSFLLIIGLTAPFLGAVAYNILHDPFDIISAKGNIPTAFIGGSGMDRYQHAGTILHYQPKSIISGHSHAANFIPSHLDRELELQDTYSLTQDGATLFEQSTVISYALKNSDVRDVLWLFGSFRVKPDKTHHKRPLPLYLYDDNRLNDFSIFLTLPMIKQVRKKNWIRNKIDKIEQQLEKQIDPRDYSTAWHWLQPKRKSYNRPVAIANKLLNQNPDSKEKISELKDEQHYSREFIELLSVKLPYYEKHINLNVLPLIKQNPETTFRLIIDPPFPLLRWQEIKATSRPYYLQHLVIMKRIVDDLEHYSNVEIYGFGTETFTNDLRLYKDGSHYHQAVNDFMLESISEGRNRITSANVIDYLHLFDEKVHLYVLPSKWDPEKSSDPNPLKGISDTEARNIVYNIKM